MKLDSTFKVPIRIRITSQESTVKVDHLNISLKAGMSRWQTAKTFFYISYHAFWLAVIHLFKRSDSE